MTPTISAPATGTPSTSSPSWLPAGETMLVSHRPKKKRFVKRPISRSSPSATTAPSTPMPMAATDIETSRQPAVKITELVGAVLPPLHHPDGAWPVSRARVRFVDHVGGLFLRV